ncbi:hypothetical protein AAZX31_01G076600 [Glycine max]
MFRTSIRPLAIHDYLSFSPEIDQRRAKAYDWSSSHIQNVLNIFSCSLADERSMVQEMTQETIFAVLLSNLSQFFS